MPLDTKVRIKLGSMATVVMLVLALGAGSALASAPKCDKRPLGQNSAKTWGDNGFKISVVGAPVEYRPGDEYTVILSGERQDEGDLEPKKVKFIDFMIVAESNLPSTEVHGLGQFQLMPGDAMSKFSHKCSHAVMATSALSKEEVKVKWFAPVKDESRPSSGPSCIQLKAMVVERNDYWFMDDGALTYTICEGDVKTTSPVVSPCQACDEAKYEVIFEGLWSRHTHPKDFPSNEWQTAFSQMIGASHSIDYDLWKYGELSSPALQMLAESGHTRKLENDMKRSSKNIRSVIKAKGLQQRSNVVGRTFAVFRVDATKHLLSLVSKMIPSPDWIVGVSMENLCLANGSWVDSRVIDLYPWDAGSNSGMSYQEHGAETQPRESIHEITSCLPHDDRSPFFDVTCAPIKPVARLHILKQREYKKVCAEDNMRLNPSWEGPNAPSINGENIYAGTGIGPNMLPEAEQETQYSYGDYEDQQTYRDQSRGQAASYASARSSSSSYSGSSRSSGYSSIGNSQSSSPCQLTQWSSWSQCSQSCDSGSRSRSRKFINPVGSQISNCKQETFKKQPCPGLPKCAAKSYAGNYDPFFSQDELSEYSSPWSNRGLSSKSLMKATEDQKTGKTYKKSYLHETNYNSPQPQVGNPQEYDPLPTLAPPVDPYSDPYNKYSGYRKQKGYPPRNNHPSSSRYNPYKDLGYYGYTYAGPPAGRYSQQPNYMADDGKEADSSEDARMSSDTGGCEVAQWGDWSHCSTKCGTGSRTRTRQYISRLDTARCAEELFEDENCEERSGCYDTETATKKTPREKVKKMKRKQTTSSYRRPAETTTAASLPQPRPHRQRQRTGAGGAKRRRPPFNRKDAECAVAEWTEWSPCSQTCDKGYKIRTRIYLVPFIPNRVCDNVVLTQKQDCREATCWSSDYYDTEDGGARGGLGLQLSPALETEYDEIEDKKFIKNIGFPPLQPHCSLDMKTGFCYGSMERWFYNATNGQCSKFKYTGCAGNKNNFATESECMEVCRGGGDTAGGRFTRLQSLALVRSPDYGDEDILLGDDPEVADRSADCQVTEWSAWSTCTSSCGRGWMYMERAVLAQPGPGGRACPRKLTKRRRCVSTTC